ncbi:MAG: hypothetical protein JWM91_4486 [Rhodospirillales bacterium]|nr:hypothetical protein [Rhodospirillales bacterium]
MSPTALHNNSLSLAGDQGVTGSAFETLLCLGTKLGSHTTLDEPIDPTPINWIAPGDS